jgi:hypothetical protein
MARKHSTARVALMLAVLVSGSVATTLDRDNDGVPNRRDYCPLTSRRAFVDALGCERKQIDIDFDGVCDVTRPRNRANEPRASIHCAGIDNCKHVKNPTQSDVNGNGKGDACDRGL